jgi:hypothetical protein
VWKDAELLRDQGHAIGIAAAVHIGRSVAVAGRLVLLDPEQQIPLARVVLEGFRQLERQRAECALAEARARADDRHLGDFLDPSFVVGLEVRGDGIGRDLRH